jgi:hypothetical protein
MGEKKNAYRILMGKPEGKRPLGRERRRWLDNITAHKIMLIVGLLLRYWPIKFTVR